MAARRGRNGQFTKSKRRRRTTSTSNQPRRTRRKPAISALKVAEQVLVANAVTQGLFGANLRTFVTGKMDSGVLSNIYNPSTQDNVVTLPEMLGIDRALTKTTTTKGQSYNLQPVKVDPSLQLATIKENLMANGLTMVGQVVAIPLVFKFGKKFLAKPLINPANRLIRAAGVKEVKV